MKYRELLNKAKEMNISAHSLAIADALDNTLDFIYNEEEFERLCDFGADVLLNDDNKITTEIVAREINSLVTQEGKSVDEVLEMDSRDFLKEVSYLLFD